MTNIAELKKTLELQKIQIKELEKSLKLHRLNCYSSYLFNLSPFMMLLLIWHYC